MTVRTVFLEGGALPKGVVREKEVNIHAPIMCDKKNILAIQNDLELFSLQ